METRRSTRLSLKENAKSGDAFKTRKQIADAERDGSASPVPAKKSKSSYFDPDFSEQSDDSDSLPQKKRPKGKTNSKPTRKSKQRYESEGDGSSDEFVQKPKSFTEILQSKSELKLSSDESDSCEESPPKRIKKSDGSPAKKKPSSVKPLESDSSSDVFIKPISTELKSDSVCKNEPLDDKEEQMNSQAEYFDFTALVNKVKACNEDSQVEQEVETETEPEPEKEVKPKLLQKSKKAAKVKPKNEEKTDLEVFELLAMGEDTDLSAKDIKESVTKSSEEKYEIPNQVEVLLDAPILKKKKTNDLEMTLRRRLNFIRRENQVYIHKVHILCWIAHGMHVNSVLNSPDLLSLALSLLPSDKCYPSKRMDMNYLGQLIEWFAKKIKVKKEPLENKKIKLMISLQTQFQKLEAENKTDLCFMFICVIRALGIKCRLIINLNVVPLKPTSDQLLSITVKKNDNQPTSTKKMLEKENSVKEKSSAKKELKISKKDDKESEKSKTPARSRSEKESKNDSKEKSSRSQSEKSKSTVTERSSRSKSKNVRASDRSRSQPEKSKESNDRSPCSKSEKSKESNDRSSRSKSEKSGETNNRSSRSQSEKSKEKDAAKGEPTQRSNSRGKKSEAEKSQEPRRSTRSKSTDAKKQSEYFQDEKTSRRSERVSSKSNYFSKDNESKSVKGKESCKKKSKKSSKDEKESTKETGYLVEEMSSSDDSDDTDDTFVRVKKKKIDRRVLSSEEDVNVEEKLDVKCKQNKMNYWLEVYLEAEEQWICVDIAKKSYHCIQPLYNATTHPVRYILAFNSDQTVKDVTRRYVPQYLSVTRKLRVDDNWWKSTLNPYKPSQTPQEQEEDEALDRVLEEQPLPTAISEYKNHPLYALKRHLLKFQGIYPADAPPLGFVKGEPVYSRLCVHQLHGREMWIKEAKVVKMGEKPYKIVKGRQKKDKFGTDEGPKDLELFGLWQTEDYVPPVAENGIVPRNSFGNVELFKMCMLPKGTVYLQIPGLQRVANKLNIDCAAAITGFEYSTNGWSYPVKDGFVVCEEYKDILLDAYNQEVEEAEKKEKQKREERVYANWRRLIKGLFIREKLKRRYNFGDPGTSSDEKEKSESK